LNFVEAFVIFFDFLDTGPRPQMYVFAWRVAPWGSMAVMFTHEKPD